MKKLYILGIIGIIAVIVSIIFFNNQKEDNLITTETDCEKLAFEINNLIEEVKLCESGSDCFIDTNTHLGCPFGCFQIRSHLYDDGEYLSLIQAKTDQYHDKCPICEYECPIAPEFKDIKCINNKCSDTRFSE